MTYQVTTEYRPISLLTIFSKILEKAMASIREENMLLSENQYGSGKQRSTMQAVTDLYINALNGLLNKEYTLALFIDLSKAISSVHHATLLSQLETNGFN